MPSLKDIDWEAPPAFIHRGVTLELTCGACPEQYDAYDAQGVQIGYFRLRHGRFTVETPDCGGTLVYSVDTIGDGIFNNDERDRHLKAGVDAILDQGL